MASHVFFGASFASPLEVEQAVLHGLDSQLLWGSSYPHLEGTFVYPDGRDMPSVTRLSLRNTFCDVPAAAARRMVGEAQIDLQPRRRRPPDDRAPDRRADHRGARRPSTPSPRARASPRSGPARAAGAETQRLMALQMVEGRANSGSGPSAPSWRTRTSSWSVAAHGHATRSGRTSTSCAASNRWAFIDGDGGSLTGIASIQACGRADALRLACAELPAEAGDGGDPELPAMAAKGTLVFGKPARWSPMPSASSWTRSCARRVRADDRGRGCCSTRHRHVPRPSAHAAARLGTGRSIGRYRAMKRTRFAEYQDRYDNYRFELSAEGILLMQCHTDGRSLVWDWKAHDEMADAFADVAGDRDIKVLIHPGTGESYNADWGQPAGRATAAAIPGPRRRGGAVHARREGVVRAVARRARQPSRCR